MSTTVYTLDQTWNTSNRYTAAADIDVRIQNKSDNKVIYWEITSDDTAPTISVSEGAEVGAKGKDTVSLKTGDRLWLTGDAMKASILLLTP